MSFRKKVKKYSAGDRVDNALQVIDMTKHYMFK